MKKLLSILFGLLALIVIIAMVAASQLDLNGYKAQLASAVKEKAGYDLTIGGDIKLSVLPLPHLTVGDVVLANGAAKLVQIKNVDVRVALVPLLSKKIEVERLLLEAPQIALATDATGKGNWVTAQMEQAAPVTPDAAPAAPPAAEAAPLAVTVKDLEIKDGTLDYVDGKTNTVQKLVIPNLKARADSLQGPFAADGKLVYNTLPITLKAQSGKLVDSGQTSPIQISLDVADGATKLDYEGVWQRAPALKLEGDIAVAADDLAKTLSALQNKDVELAGDLNKPVGLSGRLSLDNGLAQVTQAKLKALGLEWNGQIATRGFAPSNDANAASAAKEIAVDLVSKDKPEGTGLPRLLAGSDIKVLAAMTGQQIDISRADVKTADTAFNVKGQYLPAASDAALASLTLTGAVDRLDIDSLQGAAGADTKAAMAAQQAGDKVEKAASGTPATITGFTLPINVKADLTIGSIHVQGKDISNVKLAVVGQGKRLAISNLALQTVADTSLTASGVIGDTQALSGLDLTINGKTGDVENLAAAFGQKMTGLETKIGPATLAAKLSGSVASLNFDAAVSALSASVGAKGIATGLPANVGLSNLTFNLKHPNLVKAIQIVKPDFAADAYLAKPVNITSSLNMADKKISIASLSGQLGPLPIASAKLDIDQGGSVPAVSGTIALGDLVLPGGDSAGKSAATAKTAAAKASPAASSSGKWSTAPIKLDWLNSVKLDLDASAKSISQNRWRLDNAKTKVSVSSGTLSIPSLSAGMFGGTASLNGKLSQNSGGTITTNWSGTATNINGQSLLSALQDKNATTLEATIDSFKFDISTAGMSESALVSALEGQLVTKANNIVINGIDIPKLVTAMNSDFDGLSSITNVLDSSLNSGSTRFDTLDATMPIKGGVATMNPVYLDSATARMDLTGTVSLPRWYMDLKADVKLKQPANDPPTFNMLFRGPIDQPGKSIGQAALQHQLQKRLGKKINKVLDNSKVGKELNKLGLGQLLGAPAAEEAAPATGTGATGGTDTAPVQQQQQQPAPTSNEEAAKQLLKSLF